MKLFIKDIFAVSKFLSTAFIKHFIRTLWSAVAIILIVAAVLVGSGLTADILLGTAAVLSLVKIALEVIKPFTNFDEWLEGYAHKEKFVAYKKQKKAEKKAVKLSKKHSKKELAAAKAKDQVGLHIANTKRLED